MLPPSSTLALALARPLLNIQGDSPMNRFEWQATIMLASVLTAIFILIRLGLL